MSRKAKAQVIAVRRLIFPVSEDLEKAIEEFRKKEGLRSTASAIRCLIERGLS